jgi:hypothetical protein
VRVLLAGAIAVGSVALAGFGIDSVIEIVASTVVIWQLNGLADEGRERTALRIIAVAFALLARHSRRRGVPLAREPTIAQRANVIALPRPDRELLGDATHLQLTLVRSRPVD